MNSISRLIIVAVLALCASSCSSLRSPREATDLSEVMTLLHDANTLSLRDVARNESGLGMIEYPYVIEGTSSVRRVASLIEEAQFQFDDEFTHLLRDGGAVDANVFIEVLIDGKVSFMIFTENSIKTSGFKVYTAKKYDPMKEEMFAKDLNRLIEKIGRKPQQPPASDVAIRAAPEE